MSQNSQIYSGKETVLKCVNKALNKKSIQEFKKDILAEALLFLINNLEIDLVDKIKKSLPQSDIDMEPLSLEDKLDPSQKTTSSNTICPIHKKKKCRKSDCHYEHPQWCSKLLEKGLQPYQKDGCSTKCDAFHPRICHSSLKYRRCLNPKCRNAHIKGTKRFHLHPSASSMGPNPYGQTFGVPPTQPWPTQQGSGLNLSKRYPTKPNQHTSRAQPRRSRLQDWQVPTPLSYHTQTHRPPFPSQTYAEVAKPSPPLQTPQTNRDHFLALATQLLEKLMA